MKDHTDQWEAIFRQKMLENGVDQFDLTSNQILDFGVTYLVQVCESGPGIEWPEYIKDYSDKRLYVYEIFRTFPPEDAPGIDLTLMMISPSRN